MILLPSIAAYCHLLYGSFPKSQETSGIFSISSFKVHQSPFQKGYAYQGTFYVSNAAVPCTIYTLTQNPLPANSDYFLTGTLNQRGPFEYAFKPKQWTPVPYTWSLAQLRYDWKLRYRNFLEEKLKKHPHAADFFFALTTGDLDNRLLRYEFERIGLQHILGVSGFHFAILATAGSFFLSYFLTRFWKWIVLLSLLTLYYLFIGDSPAVQRCWLMAFIYLIGKLLNRPTNALNLLGCTLAAEIVMNPLIIPNIGFQLSFASCFGIFLLYPIYENKLRTFLPKRSIEIAQQLSFLSKHVYLLSGFLRRVISLGFAVNTTIIPILIVHFHGFPILSLFYNLFYPFFADAAVFALLLALILYPLFPPIGLGVFSFAGALAAHLLDLASYPPLIIDRPMLTPYFPQELIPFYLFLLFHCIITHCKTNSYNDYSILPQ